MGFRVGFFKTKKVLYGWMERDLAPSTAPAQENEERGEGAIKLWQ